MYPAVVPEDSTRIFRHALSGAGLIFPHHRPRILAAPEIRPGIITAPLSNEPGFSYIGSDQDTPRDKTGPRLFLHTTFPIFDRVSDTPARQNASKLAFALAYSYIGFAQDTPSRHNQTFGLLLRSTFRIFGPALDTSAERNAQINLAFRPAYSYLCSRY